MQEEEKEPFADPPPGMFDDRRPRLNLGLWFTGRSTGPITVREKLTKACDGQALEVAGDQPTPPKVDLVSVFCVFCMFRKKLDNPLCSGKLPGATLEPPSAVY